MNTTRRSFLFAAAGGSFGLSGLVSGAIPTAAETHGKTPGVDMAQVDIGKLQSVLRKDGVYLHDVPPNT